MATKCSSEVTVTDLTDADHLTLWHRITASPTLPAVPTWATDAAALAGEGSTAYAGWCRTEPGYDATQTTYLYTCLQCVWGDGTCDWGEVQLSSSYEAAKQAANDAAAASAKGDAALANDVPNLVPHLSSLPVTPSENAYWVVRSGTRNALATFEDVGDGWVHVRLDNTANTAVSRCDFTCAACPSVRAEGSYTFLFEYRSNQSVAGTSGANQTYIVQQGAPVSVQFWGNYAASVLQGSGVNCTVNLDSISTSCTMCDDGVWRKRVVRAAEAEDSPYYDRTGARGCFCFTAYAAAGGVLDVEMRVSLYEGEYTGPYKPYSGAQLYPTQADLADAMDDASKVATSYLVDLADGVMVHPAGDATTGWSIRSAIELLKSGTSYLKAWLDGASAKVRVGLEAAGHATVTPDGLDVCGSDGSTVVAQLTSALARVGAAASRHIDITSSGVSLYQNASTLLGSFTSAGVSQYVGGVLRTALTAVGLDIYDADGATSVASFGSEARVGVGDAARVVIGGGGVEMFDEDGVRSIVIDSDGERIGADSDTQVLIDSDSLSVVDADDGQYFFVGNETDEQTISTVTDTWEGDGSNSCFYLRHKRFSGLTSNAIVVKLNGTTVSSGYAEDGRAAYYSSDGLRHGFVYLRVKDGDGNYAPPSVGDVVTATYDAYGVGAHALTFGNRKDGATVLDNTATLGVGLDAARENQTVVGQYNAAASSSVLVVGTGTADDDRDNALWVSSSGLVYAKQLRSKQGITIKTDDVYAASSLENKVEYPATLTNLPALSWPNYVGSNHAKIQPRLLANGFTELAMTVERMYYDSGFRWRENGLYIRVDASGNCEYEVTDPDAFCSAILPSTSESLATGNASSGTVTLVQNAIAATVFVNQVRLSVALANGSSAQIATVPSGHRPVALAVAPTYAATNGYPHGVCVQVTTAGVVQLINRSGAALSAGSHSWYATVTYVM